MSPNKKIVITDHVFDDTLLEERAAAALGVDLVCAQTKDAARLATAVADADAVITQFAPINADVIAAMSRARVIIRYGICVDNVDLAAARNRGIPVCNIPDYCIDEVADHAVAFILSLTRQVVPQDREIHKGRWRLVAPPLSFGVLSSLTAGVIGFGRIGRAVVRRLVAFGGRVLVTDPFAEPQMIRAAGAEGVTIRKLMRASDVITLHCPSLPETKGLIDSSRLAEAKRGLLVVNVSRGDLVDTDALIEALDAGRVAGAALDVFSTEPIPEGHPILKRSNVILSPHVASVSAAAVQRLRTSVIDLALTAIRGGQLRSIVNDVSAARAADL